MPSQTNQAPRNSPTSVVTHVPDNFLLGDSAGYTKFMQESGDQRYALAQFMKIALGNDSPVFLCTVSVRKGYADGKATCQLPRTNTKIMEASFDGGRLSGKFVYYNPDKPNQTLIEGGFDENQPDGTEKIYSSSTGELVKKVGWSKGTYDGAYARYNETSGKIIQEGTYDEGKLDGLWKGYTADGKQLIFRERLKKNQLDGVAEKFDSETGKRTSLVDKWVDGKINGEQKTWDKNGILLTDEVYDDGQKVADKNTKEASSADSESLRGRLDQALAGPASTSTSTPSTPAATSANRPTTDSTAANASPVPPVTVDACVQGWTEAQHKEAAKAGVDDAVSVDQISEWEAWCKDGKQAPPGG